MHDPLRSATEISGLSRPTASRLARSGISPDPYFCRALDSLGVCRLDCAPACLLARMLAAEANGDLDVLA